MELNYQNFTLLSSAKRPHLSSIGVHYLSHKKRKYTDEQQFFILT